MRLPSNFGISRSTRGIWDPSGCEQPVGHKRTTHTLSVGNHTTSRHNNSTTHTRTHARTQTHTHTHTQIHECHECHLPPPLPLSGTRPSTIHRLNEKFLKYGHTHARTEHALCCLLRGSRMTKWWSPVGLFIVCTNAPEFPDVDGLTAPNGY